MTCPGPAERAPLVGLVVVSHSRPLARAAVALATEMVPDGTVRIAVAAGLDEETLGTDAVAIGAAISEVDGPAGVVVLMDLGSAVMSAELALELLEDPGVRERVLLSSAPLVEGLVVAAVAAAGGADRADVAAEAQGALLAKSAHLGDPGHLGGPAADAPPQTQAEPGGPTVTTTLTIDLPHGLHARPAARLVTELRGLDARIELRNATTGAGPVPATSLSRVATLAALQNHEVEVSASGAQAQEAVDRLVALAARHFDENPETPPARATTPTRGPLAASPGIAIGPVRHLTLHRARGVRARADGRSEQEAQRSASALSAVKQEIERVKSVTTGQAGAEQAAIFDAHLALLEDTEIRSAVSLALTDGGSAVTAWQTALGAVERAWAALPDPYLRARAEDVRAVAAMVRQALTGESAATLSGPGILITAELAPAQAAELDRDAVRGFVLAYGSPTSHAAILARSRGIPALVAAGAAVLEVAEGTTVIIDGSTGELVVDPSPEEQQKFSDRAARFAVEENEFRAAAQQPAITADGVLVKVNTNLGAAADAAEAAAGGADGVGLVRTEFLFLDRTEPPTVDEQVEHYRQITTAFAPRRVTLRTLDVGGDKPLDYLPMPPEDNPFLGSRGLRLTLERPELMLSQLQAVCVVARESPLNLMFPMVSVVAELRAALDLLDQAAGERGRPAGLRIGIMVEVPAAALKLPTFLTDLDFVSIGTNDLTQYTLAAERGNAAVAGLSDALDPGVLQLIDRVVRTAGERVSVSVCGEVAGDPVAVPVLLGLGVRDLSVSARAVPGIKARVRQLDLDRCRSAAEAALLLPDAAAVREHVRSVFS